MIRRRSPITEDHENLERWMVSYADFVTLLFAFFVVMYAISSINEGKYKQLSTSMLTAFQGAINPTILTTGGPANVIINLDQSNLLAQNVKTRSTLEHEAQIAQLRQKLDSVLAPLTRGGQVKVTQDKHAIAIQINDSALFESGGAQPRGTSAHILSEVGRILSDSDHPIRVEGFSDNIPIRNAFFPSNWELSAARAGSIVRLFEENGVIPERLVAIGRAETQPIGDNTTAEGRAQNRRVSIKIMTEHRDDPTLPIDELRQNHQESPPSDPLPIPAP